MNLTCVTAVYNAIKSGNRENLIRCVRSVAALKTPHEHLIYDGASTDGTVELLCELEAATPGLKVVSEPDTGIYNALNKGTRDARGEWFYVLGCDDEIVNADELENAMAEGERTNATAVAAPVYDDRNTESYHLINHNCIFFGTPYPHQGFLIRTDQLRAMNGFNEAYSLAADYELMLRLLRTNRSYRSTIAFYDRPFAYYCPGGLSSNVKLCHAEFDRAISDTFEIDLHEAMNVRMKYPKSLQIITKCLFHKSSELRSAGRYLLVRYLVGRIGLLRDDGALKWRPRKEAT